MRKMSAVLVCLGVFTLLFAGACEKEKYIKSWSITSDYSSFNVVTKFAPEYEIDLAGEFMYKTFGRALIYTDTDGLFTVDLKFLRSIVGDIGLTPATGLPTGVDFPSIINESVSQITLAQDEGKFRVIAYFDLFARGQTPNLVGLAIELGAVDNSFPQLAVTQNYYNDSNQKIAAFTIYGPMLDSANNVVVPGGIFIAADYSFVYNGQSRIKGNVEITGPDAKNIDDLDKDVLLQRVFDLAKEKGVLR